MTKIGKKIIAALLTCAISAVSFSPLALAQPSEWAATAVGEFTQMGIIPTEFNDKWQDNITRLDFCRLAYNVLCAITGDIKSINAVSPFTDTDSREAALLHSFGIINGKSETEFAPYDMLTRQEAATILNRAMLVIFPDSTVSDNTEKFSDDADIADWAKASVYSMKSKGIIKGTDKGFEPLGGYTVEQSCVTMYRMAEKAGIFTSADNGGDSFTDKFDSLMPYNENYTFSPLSVSMVLGLAANGADGDTKTEIMNTLGITDLDAYNAQCKALIEKYSKAEILQINTANSVWVNKSKTVMDFSDSYEKKAAEFYDATVKTVDDSNAVSEVNSWVNDKTNGKIPSIISAPDFWAALVNAVYFKGAWQYEFFEGATKSDNFNNADGSVSQTDFMNARGYYDYCEIDGAKMIKLPYKNSGYVKSDTPDKKEKDGERFGMLGGMEDGYEHVSYDDLDIAMYIILPNDVKTQIVPEATVKKAVDGDMLKRTYTDLSIPKFKLEYSSDIKETLTKLGMEKAFTDNADFKPMFKDGNMYVTDVLHKTYINVDEKGTEAAAVTFMGMAGSAMPPEPIEFKADRPFMFVIYDAASGQSLFVGQYAKVE